MKFFLSLVIFFIFYENATSQLTKTLHFTSRNGMFCSQSIILDSTGLFFSESGCEGRSTISFGRYEVNQSSIINFEGLPFDSLEPVRKIVQDSRLSANDSLITITFFDRYNIPLDVNHGIRISDTLNQVHEMSTDEEGKITINRFLFKYVSLVQFLTIYKETDGIPVGKFSLNVYLNLPESLLIYPELSILKPSNLKLKMRKKGLSYINSKKIIYAN